ncbi:TGRM2 protein, partial [Centropus bengalensis]|nr:TGRM2 protein [Centropus bengalensis]
ESEGLLKALRELLTAKEFKSRMEGVQLLREHCENNPLFISTNVVQIFNSFAPRLQDCHKKVCQQALKALAFMIPILKGALHPVLDHVVTAATESLNTKHSGIYVA